MADESLGTWVVTPAMESRQSNHSSGATLKSNALANLLSGTTNIKEIQILKETMMMMMMMIEIKWSTFWQYLPLLVVLL
jgi:hypothetical protein